jgi:hypothetical protein
MESILSVFSLKNHCISNLSKIDTVYLASCRIQNYLASKVDFKVAISVKF